MNIRSIIQYRQGAWGVAMCAALFLLAGCQRDELAATMPGNHTLNFQVGVTDEWNHGNASVPDSMAKKGGGAASSGRRLPEAVAPAVRAFSLASAPGADPLYLHTSVAGTVATALPAGRKVGKRGKPVEDEGGFYDAFGVFGYLADAWDDGGMPVYFHNVKVAEGDGDFWLPETEYHWPGRGQGLFIWAYAPYAAEGLGLPDSDGGSPSFTYTVPEGAEEQQDLLVAEPPVVSGEPDGGVLPLEFRHVLTAVRFVTGKDVRPGTIGSITLKGVCGNGAYTRGAGAWELSAEDDDIRDFTYVFDSPAEVGGSEGEQIQPDEATFMMLPQTLPEDAQIEVVFKEGKTNGAYTLTASLAGDKWTMGTTVTYCISIKDFSEENTIRVEFADKEFDYKGGTGAFTVESFTTVSKEGLSDTYAYAQPWTVEFSIDGGNTWGVTPPDWFTGQMGGEGGEEPARQSFTVKEQVPRKEDPHNDALQEKTALTEVYDLSTQGGHAPMNTANCYIVNQPGTYKLPLVYGNAIKDNKENTQAYQPSVSGANVLSSFVNHLGTPIASPYIYRNADCVPKDAVLVWQDREGMILQDEVELVDDDEDGTYDYLQFVTAGARSEAFKQGNAILAVRDASGRIMWSWHIWVTDYEPGLLPVEDEYKPEQKPRDRVVKVKMGDKPSYTFMGVPLGFSSGNYLIYDERKVKVRFVQANTGQTSGEYEIRQDSFYVEELGDCVYYQFGRKDPMLPLIYDRAHENVSKDCFGPLPLGTASGKVSVGTAIQHPNIFYTTTEAKHEDWCESTYNNLWNATNTGTSANSTVVKTVYDPSPAGYCLPPANAFTGFTYDGNGVSGYSGSTYGMVNSPYTVGGQGYKEFDYYVGWIFYCNPMSGLKGWNPSGGSVFFGAFGFRYIVGGGGGWTGSNGCYWSADPAGNSNNGHHLHFTSGIVRPRYTEECRSYGCTVRPVREE